MIDFRPLPNVEVEGDGQIGYWSEYIAPDEYYNCTWEMLRQTCRVYGYGGYDDEQFRHIADQVLGRPANHVGERWENSLAVARALWPDLAADMAVWYPRDVLDAIHQATLQGWRVHAGFWCDVDAWVPAQGAVTYSHCLGNLWMPDDLSGVGWRNPEPHPDVFLDNGQIVSLNDGGGMLVFKRPLQGAPPINPTPPVPLKEDPDDMSERTRVASGTAYPFSLAADEDLNFSTEVDGTKVRLDGDDVNGTPTGVVKELTLKGNVPDQHGPDDQTVTAGDMGIVPPGGTINVNNEGPGEVFVWSHRG